MDSGREVVIVEAVRTPIGRGHREKGYYKDTHPNELLGKTLHRGDRPRRDRSRRRRGRDRRLRAAVRRADVQRHAQRVAAGRAAGRDAGDDRRPPVRLGPAGGQLRRGADRRGRPRRRDRRRRRAHGAHPDGVGFKWVEDVGTPYPPEMLARYDLVPQGLSAEMIADQWEIPRAEMDELAVRSHQLAARATEEGRFEREIVPVPGQRRHPRGRPGDPARHEPRGARRAQAGVQARRQGHRRQRVADLRRRRRGAADVGRQGEGARARRRARGSSTRRRSGWTR